MINNKIRDMYMGYHHNVNVCEIDIVNSTQWVANHTPIEIYATMCKLDKLVSSLTQEHDVCSFEFVGDSVVVVSKSTIQLLMFCHVVIMKIVPYLKHEVFCDDKINVRIGLDMGSIFVGYINGYNFHQIFGKVINVATRLEQLAMPGTINVSEQVYKTIESNASFTKMFSVQKPISHNLKGIGNINLITLLPIV